MDYAKRSLIAVAIGVAIVSLSIAIAFAARALLVIFAGILLAVLLRALADMLARHARLHPSAALLMVVTLIAGGLVAGAWFLAAEAGRQLQDLGATLTGFLKQFTQWLSRYGWGQELLRAFLDESAASNKADILSKAIASTLTALSTLVVALFVGVYVAAAPERYRSGVLRLVPGAHRDRAAEVLDDLHQALRGWLVGTLINMTAVGVVTTIGLWLLGVPFALALGLLAFVLEFVPYLGPILSAVPAVLVALSVEPVLAGYTLLFYVAVQQFEEYVLVPYVYQRSVHLAPALTIGAQVVLGSLLGVLGVIFATPLTACATVLVRELYVKDALDKKEPVP